MSFIDQFSQAVQRFEEILQLPKDNVVRDSTIKRFEICFDLAWKAIKHFAAQEGLDCYSPRSCFQTGFQLGLIDYDAQWLTMIEDRNKTSHLYSESLADEVYQHLPSYSALFRSLLARLTKKK